MKIQSLSIHVPAKCPNKCSFCVSRMHDDTYENLIEKNDENLSFFEEEYIDRLAFARDNGCNTIILTGNGEPLMNRTFLQRFAYFNQRLGDKKFRWIEIQTSGVLLDNNYAGFLRKVIGVKIISLSLSDMFNSERNAFYNNTKKGLEINIPAICKLIKSWGFGLRLSLNMTDAYNNKSVEEIFDYAKKLGANQITFRKLYTTPGKDNPEDKWIMEHSCADSKLHEIREYIKEEGVCPRVLPFGAVRYIVNEISTVIDDNCMAKGVLPEDTVKYLILRPNCKLYDQWDNPGSLIY